MKPIEPVQLAALFQKPAAAAAPGAAGFGDALKAALASVDRAQVSASELARRFQANDPEVSLEQTMLAMNRANLSLQALVQTRNRFIQAYQDIMNMPV